MRNQLGGLMNGPISGSYHPLRRLPVHRKAAGPTATAPTSPCATTPHDHTTSRTKQARPPRNAASACSCAKDPSSVPTCPAPPLLRSTASWPTPTSTSSHTSTAPPENPPVATSTTTPGAMTPPRREEPPHIPDGDSSRYVGRQQDEQQPGSHPWQAAEQALRPPDGQGLHSHRHR